MNARHFAVATLALALVLLGGRMAAQSAPAGRNFVALPLIVNGSPCTDVAPQLLGPPNGSVVETLIPLLEWDNRQLRDAVEYYYQGSTTPDFAALEFEGSGPYTPGVVRVRSLYNRRPNTTYYWRVRFECQQGGTTLSGPFSETWTLTITGNQGPIPGTPALAAPPDGSVVGPDALLQWTPVDGAVAYVIYYEEADAPDPTLRAREVSGTQVALSELEVTANTRYRWRVGARNDFAIGIRPDPWTFTVAP